MLEPSSQLLLCDFAGGQAENRNICLFLRGYDFETVYFEKDERNQQGRSLVSIYERMIR